MNQLQAVRSLQQRISEMQPLRLAENGLPVAPELRPLLPGGMLRKGAVASVQGSLQIALSLMSAASAKGAWCGAIGLPNLGLEAAAQLGIALDRFALVPNPGSHAIGITGMLSEVLSVLVLRTSAPPSAVALERLHGRLREHSTSLIVLGQWPRSEVTLRVTDSRWIGLGYGRGLLQRHELTVLSNDRRGKRSHLVCFTDGKLTQGTG